MSDNYEERQAARKERLENRAARLRAASAALHARARQMADCIPFGQPILCGHHSEGRDRRFRGRIHATFRKAFDLADKAERAAERAAAAGSGGISSDDPEALRKLRDKLQAAEEAHEAMVKANRAIRKAKTPEERVGVLVALGFTEARALEILKPDCFGYVGFAPFSLSNSKGRISQIKDRITALERKQARAAALAEQNPTGEAAKEEQGNGYTFREDLEENRYMFMFPGKPDFDTRAILKRYGFKWSPTRGAWVRQISGSGRWAVDAVKAYLSRSQSHEPNTTTPT